MKAAYRYESNSVSIVTFIALFYTFSVHWDIRLQVDATAFHYSLIYSLWENLQSLTNEFHLAESNLIKLLRWNFLRNKSTILSRDSTNVFLRSLSLNSFTNSCFSAYRTLLWKIHNHFLGYYKRRNLSRLHL